MTDPAKLTPVKITRLEAASTRAIFVRLEGGDPALYDAHKLPARSIQLRVGGVGPFPVPLASQPDRKWLEVVLDRDDPLAQAFAKLAPGAEVEVSAPSGGGFPVFDYRRNDLYLVGYGTSVGVLRSVVLHALTERGAFDHLRVLVEARFLEMPFRDEFPAWQRAGVRIYQSIPRPDMGKWKKGEGAYVFDILRDLEPDPARSVIFAAGPPDMLQGVQGVCRTRRIPPQKIHVFEHSTAERERAREPERPKALVDKITAEGTYGSGHQNDAADHSPGYRTTSEQPTAEGLPPYKRPQPEKAH